MFVGATPPTNLMAEQNGIQSVLVSWTVPSPPPAMGYRVTVEPGEISLNISSTPLNLTSLELGIYTVRVMSLSRHFPSEAVGPVEVTVRGEYYKVEER